MNTATLDCQKEIAHHNRFATVAMELSSHPFCSNYQVLKDNTNILEFSLHSSGIFCSLTNVEAHLIWNSPTKFYNITLQNHEITPVQLKDKILDILQK